VGLHVGLAALTLALLTGCRATAAHRAAVATTSSTATVTSIATTTSVPPTTTTTAGVPVAAATSEGLAQQMSSARAVIVDHASSEEVAGRAGWTMQVAERALLLDHPELTGATLALLAPDVRAVVQSDLDAGAALATLTKKLAEKLPPWHIVHPASATELLGYYKAASAATGVPWPYLAAINLVETRMGRIRGVSTAGAQGPMQFLPSTWSIVGEGGDINSYHDAIFGAARYLKRNGAPANMHDAIWNYNHAEPYVSAVTAYAHQMTVDERAYFGYWGWQVYYRYVGGAVLLPEGWTS
jgi:membrane-bound lytic murein transglycosylase B